MHHAVRLALLAGLAIALSTPAAATDLDWSANIQLSDGERTYVSLGIAHFGADRDETSRVARRLAHPGQEIPIVMFLARESGRSLHFVLDLRLAGMSWWEIRAHLGIAPERVIVALPRDPGPPYGKAHGHYKHGHHKKGQAPARAVAISDTEFADWVGVRILSASYGVEPITVLEARRAGVSLAEFTVRHAPHNSKAAGGTSHQPGNGNKGRGAGKKR